MRQPQEFSEEDIVTFSLLFGDSIRQQELSFDIQKPPQARKGRTRSQSAKGKRPPALAPQPPAQKSGLKEQDLLQVVHAQALTLESEILIEEFML